MNVTFDASQITRIERGISPPMAVCITLPVEAPGLDGAAVFVALSPFGTEPILTGHVRDLLEIARLIAAAPELLEACKSILSAAETHGTNGQEFFEARNSGLAAIAKAEGR